MAIQSKRNQAATQGVENTYQRPASVLDNQEAPIQSQGNDWGGQPRGLHPRNRYLSPEEIAGNIKTAIDNVLSKSPFVAITLMREVNTSTGSMMPWGCAQDKTQGRVNDALSWLLYIFEGYFGMSRNPGSVAFGNVRVVERFIDRVSILLETAMIDDATITTILASFDAKAIEKWLEQITAEM